jgi:hypothetical protein
MERADRHRSGLSIALATVSFGLAIAACGSSGAITAAHIQQAESSAQ